MKPITLLLMTASAIAGGVQPDAGVAVRRRRHDVAGAQAEADDIVVDEQVAGGLTPNFDAGLFAASDWLSVTLVFWAFEM